MAQPSVRPSSVDEMIEAAIDDGFVTDDREAVVRYLGENPDLLPVLAQIKERLEPPLASAMPLRLQLSYDPEWEDDPPRLWVLIPTTLEADPALDALDDARRDWWLEMFRRYGDRLGLGLDYVGHPSPGVSSLLSPTGSTSYPRRLPGFRTTMPRCGPILAAPITRRSMWPGRSWT